jgi:hypothetical protein
MKIKHLRVIKKYLKLEHPTEHLHRAGLYGRVARREKKHCLKPIEARGHYFHFWKNNVPKVNVLFLRTRC